MVQVPAKMVQVPVPVPVPGPVKARVVPVQAKGSRSRKLWITFTSPEVVWKRISR